MSDLFGEPAYQDPDEELRQLLERQHLILAMQQTEGWAMWADFLAAVQEPYQRRLIQGRHKDLLEYRYDAGFCEGIRYALGVSEALSQRVSGLRANLDTFLPPDGGPLAMEDTEL